MRISDWSSDVCSSDLNQSPAADVRRRHLRYFGPCDGRLRGGWQSQYARQGAAVALGRGAPETVRFRDGGRGEPHLPPPPRTRRSEEHTSELQSLMRISYAVFCLKKKKT